MELMDALNIGIRIGQFLGVIGIAIILREHHMEIHYLRRTLDTLKLRDDYEKGFKKTPLQKD